MPADASAASYLGDPPDDPAELQGFPAFTLTTGTVIYRVHRATHDPWFFSTDPESRFTPAGLPEIGTCYFAAQPVGALLGALRGDRRRLVPEEEVLARRLFTVTLDRDLRLADLGHRHAGRWSVNAEIHATADYAKTQAWAAALSTAGFRGLRYLCRSDPSLKQVGWALFAKAAPAPEKTWPKGSEESISDDLIDEAAQYGLKILPTP